MATKAGERKVETERNEGTHGEGIPVREEGTEVELWSMTKPRQGIIDEVTASCPALPPIRDGRTSQRSREDKILEVRIGSGGGGTGSTNMKEQDRRGKPWISEGEKLPAHPSAWNGNSAKGTIPYEKEKCSVAHPLSS